MSALILLAAGVAMIATVLTIRAILRAPLGHEDQDGFHLDKRSPEPARRDAPVPHHGVWADR